MIAKCPKCNSVGKLADKLAGKKVRCPNCHASFVAKAGQTGRWYYAEGDRKKGPIDQEHLDRLVAAGAVAPETLVWRKGMTNWQPLGEVLSPPPARGWYYADGESKMGPVSQDQFDRLVADNAISADTLVWSKGMAGWQPLSELEKPDAAPENEKCSGCGHDFAPALLTSHAGERVCEICKLKLVQSTGKSGLKYGGLLNRFIAKAVDLLFMLAMAGMVEGLSRKLFPGSYVDNTITPVFTVTLTINMLLGIFYTTWFVGKFGATPGKMVVNLKITNPAGRKIGYMHAFGRYCGEYIASMGIMGIMMLVVFWTISSLFPDNPLQNSIVVAILVTFAAVYGPAFFDSQRRTLYDRLCNTRVISA
ncbi:MAG: GYF domain-containing protein [Desulfurivibrionaceae bacterium]|nr:GYF domain-containing protein [Desulfurivibrionaceae bacterium]